MLQVIRDRAQGFFTWLIIGVIILAFALVGLNSYFDDTDEGFQAALVNDQKVSVYEYQIAYSNEMNRMRQMFGENFDQDMFDDQVKRSALARVVDNAVVIQHAMEKGMHVSDEQLALRVQNIGAFMENGVFSKAAYDQQISQSGESIAGFEYRVRRGLIADQLVNGIVLSSFSTQDEIATMLKLRNQTREIGYVTIPTAKFKENIEITDDEIKTYYDANQNKYKTQEKVQLSYVELKVEDLLKTIVVDESELVDYYDSNKNSFVTPEQRRARHILIEFGDDKDVAKNKAQSIYDKIQAGEDFETLAKENSDDVGSANEGGDLGFFNQGDMDESVDEKVFSMAVAEVSTPVRSEFGYHIIKLEEIKEGGGKSFESVKGDVESNVKKQKADKLYADKLEKLANLAFEIPDNLDAVKEELDLTIKSTPFMPRRGGPGVFSNRKLMEAAFSEDVLKNSLNSELIEVGASHALVVRLKEFQDSAIRPLDEVKSLISDTLKKEKALETAKKHAEEIEAKIKSGVAEEDAASEKEFSWNEKKWIKRDDNSIAREIITAAFEMKRINDSELETKGVKLNNGDYALLTLTGVKDGDIATASDEDKKTIKDGISNATGIDEYTKYLDALRAAAEIEQFPQNL